MFQTLYVTFQFFILLWLKWWDIPKHGPEHGLKIKLYISDKIANRLICTG